MEARFDELVERLAEELPKVSTFYGALAPEDRRAAALNLYRILRDSVEAGGIERFAAAITQIAHSRISQGGSTDDLRAATDLIRQLNLSLVNDLAHAQPDVAVPAFAWLDRLAATALDIFNNLAQESLAQQAEELSILMTFSEQTEQIERVADIVDALFVQVPRLKADWAIVSLRADDDPSLHEIVGTFDAGTTATHELAGARFSPEPLLRHDTPGATCLPLRVADLQLSDEERKQLALAGITTLSALPIRGPQGVDGLLVLGYRRDHQVTPDEQRFLVLLMRMLRNRIVNLRLIERLSEQVERAAIFQTLVEQAGDMIVMSDLNGVVTYANGAAARLLEIDPPGAMVGRPFDEFIDVADRERVRGEVVTMLRAGQAWQGNYILLSARGTQIPVSSNAISIRNSAGERIAAGGITHDERDRLALVESLRRGNEEQQRMLELLRQLSTPLMPVMEGILVMPLVGELDSRRATQILETLLEGVTRAGADTVILDITGVPLVDDSVANALIQAARAVRLLGAEALLVGITPDVAQTLVGLGIDLSSIVTRSNLQSGIAYAMARRGLQIGGADRTRLRVPA